MKAMLRPPRVFFVFGVLLLVGTVAGASWVLNYSTAGDSTAVGKSREPGEAFTAVGFVDVEGGICMLHPLVRGRVTHIWANENEPVWQGYMLLSLQNDQAREDLNQANTALEHARNLLAIAERARPEHQQAVAAKRASLDVKRAYRDGAHEAFEKAKKFWKDRVINKFDLNIEEQNYNAAEAAVLAELHQLKGLELKAPDLDIQSAELQVRAKESLREKARSALHEYDVYAPSDGTLLRVTVNVGETISDQPKQPALQFCPDVPRIVRAEVLQEWASRVDKGQAVIIEDDTRAGPQWQGKVKSVSDWFTHRRAILLEPFQYNDVRTLECLVTVEPSNRPLRIGQRVRVTFK